MKIERRTFVQSLGAVALAPGSSLMARGRSAAAAAGLHPDLTQIRRDNLMTAEEARALHAAKDSMGGPTIAGSPSWRNFVEIAERELRGCGVVDVARNPWTYTRWSTSEWPDDSQWSLQVGGEEVRVASYGCNSGSTPEQGASGPLVLYRPGMPAEQLRGRIAVVVESRAAAILERGSYDYHSDPTTAGDYEYLADPETFSDRLRPLAEIGPVSAFLKMGLGGALPALTEAGALGAVIVIGLSYDAAAGTYTFPVPPLHQMPTLYVEVEAGAGLVAAARAGETGTLRLISDTQESETYQLFTYLPGRHYGSEKDEQILLITHTDGPSISQENGAFGIVGMVRYFSRIPQEQRPRTLMVFLDCRHYMPGAERAFEREDWASSHPEVYDRVVAAMGIEHLGQMQVSEEGGVYHRTGRPEISAIWTTESQALVDVAVRAVQDNGLRRVVVQCPARPGTHGGRQGRAYGLGAIAGRLGVTGASTMGLMSAYWSTKARLDYFAAEHFVDQVATMSQICGQLMVTELQRTDAGEQDSGSLSG